MKRYRMQLKSIFSIFFIITILANYCHIVGATKFCDLCKCFEREKVFVIECNGARRNSTTSTAHDMQYFEWPTTTLDSIHANFNNLNLTVLPRLQGDPKVSILNFDDNLIRTLGPKPFQYFQHLEEISFRNNFITDLPKDFLYGLSQVKRIQASNNSIASINVGFMSKVENVDLLDLSHNKLETISAELSATLAKSRTIDLTFNKIFALDTGNATKWRNLQLAHNNFKVFTVNTFKENSSAELEILNLSYNFLQHIEAEAFAQLPALKQLDISCNELQELNLILPDSVESIDLGNNTLRLWPLKHVPANLIRLDVHGNELSEIFPGHDAVHNLKFLNASRNVIDTFPKIQFTHLIVLDLSYNSFTEVPTELARYALQLEELIMDNNPITIINFNEKFRLNRLSFRNMPFVTSIQALSFSNVEGTKVRQDHSSTCLDVFVSHCDKLEHVSEDAFLGVRLCYLDLSYNQIKKLPSNLTDWHSLEDGVNLQGNPLSCDCDSQWMLDHIVVNLYERETHQHLLTDLRCNTGTTPVFKNQRFVRFYKHDNIFCDPDPKILRSMQYDLGTDEEPIINVGSVRVRLTNGVPTYIIIIVVSAIVLILIVISGVYLTREQNRKMNARNRRYLS